MTGLNHAMTGITIAVLTRRPEIALPLALVSHFVLDAIPHSKVSLERPGLFRSYLAIEALAMVCVTLVAMSLYPDIALLILVSAVCAFLPDFFWPFYYNGQLKDAVFFRKFYRFHKWIQWAETYRGWLVEVLYFAVLCVFLLSK